MDAVVGGQTVEIIIVDGAPFQEEYQQIFLALTKADIFITLKMNLDICCCDGTMHSIGIVRYPMPSDALLFSLICTSN